MNQDRPRSNGTSPWDILGVGTPVSVRGRYGRVVARHYLFACISYDDEPADGAHWLPIGHCVELKTERTPASGVVLTPAPREG